jgi:hypothetical protein
MKIFVGRNACVTKRLMFAKGPPSGELPPETGETNFSYIGHGDGDA